MDYGKITSENKIQQMPSPYSLFVANANENQKRLIAELDNWLEMVYAEQPQYEPSHQRLEESWVEENGKAKQVWTIVEVENEN